MADIFREVDEAVRQDRAKLLWQRYGRMAIAVALLIVGGTAGYVWYQNYRVGQMQERTVALAAALQQTETARESADALNGLANSAGGDIAMIARLYEAALLAESGDREAAVAIYSRVSEDVDVEPLWRDFAQLMSVLHQIDSGEPATLSAMLAPLTDMQNPWRHTARELSGLLAVRQGETARAAEIFAELADDAAAPAGVRQRARDLADWLGAA